MKTVALYSFLLCMHHLQPLGLCKELTVDFISIEIGYTIWDTLLYALIQVLLVTLQKI